MRSGSVVINHFHRPRALRGLGGTWDNEATAKSMMGKPKAAGEFYYNAAPFPLWDGTTYQHKRACELGQKGMEAACARFGTPFGVMTAAPAPTSTYPDYALADRQLKRMIDNVQTCQISNTSAVPSSLMLAPPDGNAPASVVAAYDSYSLRLTEFEAAKKTAGVYCSAGTNPGSGPGVQYGQPTCGFDAYGRALACGGSGQAPQSAISSEEVDLYGAEAAQPDIYTRDVATQRNYPEGGTDQISWPFGQKPVEAAPPPKKPKAAMFAAGGAALLLVAVFARKRSSRSRRSR